MDIHVFFWENYALIEMETIPEKITKYIIIWRWTYSDICVKEGKEVLCLCLMYLEVANKPKIFSVKIGEGISNTWIIHINIHRSMLWKYKRKKPNKYQVEVNWYRGGNLYLTAWILQQLLKEYFSHMSIHLVKNNITENMMNNMFRNQFLVLITSFIETWKIFMY